jgi:hypothetical protein
VRRKYHGFILQFTRSDHGGRHIHVFRDNRELGVFDRVEGPIRGLEDRWGRDLQEAVEWFIRELHERGDWQ